MIMREDEVQPGLEQYQPEPEKEQLVPEQKPWASPSKRKTPPSEQPEEDDAMHGGHTPVERGNDLDPEKKVENDLDPEEAEGE
jgi:hypothetical protein